MKVPSLSYPLKVIPLIFWMMIGAFGTLIFWNSKEFFYSPQSAPFVLERIGETPLLWLPVLVPHVIAGILCIALGPVLFLISSGSCLHRQLGKLYGILVIILVVPSGMVLALFAHGGWIGRLGFWTTGIWLGVSTCAAWILVRKGQIQAHRKWMLRSYAAATAALTFRILYVLGFFAGIPYPVNYPLSTWGGTLLNFLLVECYLRFQKDLSP